LITIWLMEHITKEDAKYASFILKKRGSPRK
jgi:hemerythrin